MISVIVCSINKNLAEQVEKNIRKTIGVDWELVLMDNTVIQKGIAHVYNRGAARAKYDILCFVHEDVLFKTNGWGSLLCNYFEKNSQLGLVGIAGSKYKSKTASGWSTGISSLDCCNILHRDTLGNELLFYSNPDPTVLLQEVVTIDGVFMCTRRDIWRDIPFNDELLNEFHVYDIDFSLSVASSYQVRVTFEIDIIHLTQGGDFGNNWLKNTLAWHGTYADKLPVCKGTSIQKNKIYKYERQVKKVWLNRLSTERISLANKIKWITRSQAWKDVLTWPHIMKFLFYRYIRKNK